MRRSRRQMLALLLVLPGVTAGCDLFNGNRYERVWTGSREEGGRYLDKNEVERCYVVVTSEPDDCDLIGVAQDQHIPVGRTPTRISVDVRNKEYSDGTSVVRLERVNETRKLKDIREKTGLIVFGWRELRIAYLFSKPGYVNKRFEEVTLSAEQLLHWPEHTYRVHAELESETLELKRRAPSSAGLGQGDFECDVRLVEVRSGRASRATTGQAENPAGFRDMAERVVFKLTERLEVPVGAKVAVLDLEEIGAKTVEGQYGRLVARMISTSLINIGKFDVIERQQLDKLLEERDLTAAQIAAAPSETGKILGLDYVVLGSVAKVR